MDHQSQKPFEVHLVTATDAPEFTNLTRVLTQASVVGLDAEWKPIRTQQTSFPTISLLQIACQLGDDSVVFLLDLFSLPLSSLWESLREMFVSPDILKLGFRFKQDLVYLSSTFCSQDCNHGFDKVRTFCLVPEKMMESLWLCVWFFCCDDLWLLWIVYRLNRIWISRVCTIICNRRNMEGMYLSRVRVCQLYVEKCWGFHYLRFVY